MSRSMNKYNNKSNAERQEDAITHRENIHITIDIYSFAQIQTSFKKNIFPLTP